MIIKPSKNPKFGSAIILQDWMIRQFNLHGTELVIYAVIHSFSKDGESVFSGSIKYLSFWTGKSKPTILNHIKSLLSRGLIQKGIVQYTGINNKRHYCKYWTTFSRLSPEEQKKILSTTG